MTKFLLPLFLLLSSVASSQPISQYPPQAGSSTATICIPIPQARVIAKSLQQYELLKPAYAKLKLANQEFRESNTSYRLALTVRDTALAVSMRSTTTAITLYEDSKVKQEQYKQKAHRNGLRFWLLLSLNVLGGAIYLSH